MIAVWMVYTVVSGTLIASVCWLLERIAGAARISTRGVWVGGMLAMLVIAAAAVVPERSAPPTASPAAMTGAPARVKATAGERPASQGLVAAVRQRVDRALVSLDTRVRVAAGRLSRWDLPLLVLWAVLAAFLGGIVAHAALEGRRLRYGLRPGEVAGTSVLLTEDMGPSAIGVGGRAILIPSWALDLDDTLTTLIVRHEREHLTARDPLLLLAALLAVVLVPWHLPLWWSRKRLLLAVEVDCDSRVLRAHPDVRRYGQLLLLAAQRSPRPAWANLAVVTVVAPLRPHASHLARRISAMTQPRAPRLLLRAVPLVVGAVALATLVVALPAPRRAQAQTPRAGHQARALVHLTDLGSVDTNSPPSIVVYTTGGGQVGIGTDPPSPIADTLRLNGLPAMTADVTDGDVQIELRGPGSIRVGGEVTGGPALKVAASGRHIVLFKGGTGIGGRP
jgi:beta-lactamase regulating signal transducer with metallopeptidase domain